MGLWVVLPLLVCMVIELSYKESFYAFTLEMAPKMQKKRSLYSFFYTISEVGGIYITLFSLLLAFNLMSKLQALYVYCAVATASYLCGIMKTLYAEPRPFWVSDDIQAF